jgi:hypothetical protein
VRPAADQQADFVRQQAACARHKNRSGRLVGAEVSVRAEKAAVAGSRTREAVGVSNCQQCQRVHLPAAPPALCCRALSRKLDRCCCAGPDPRFGARTTTWSPPGPGAGVGVSSSACTNVMALAAVLLGRVCWRAACYCCTVAAVSVERAGGA